MRYLHRPSHVTVVAYLALFVALGGGALAATGFVGSDGRIHGCVTKNGKLMLVKPNESCTNGSPIAWNRRGPRGKKGENGKNGIGQTGSPAASMLVGRVDSLFGGYVYPVGWSGGGVSESAASMLSPAVTVVARDLFVREDHPYGGSPDITARTYTLSVNGADTAVSCSINSNTSNSNPVFCKDITHTATIPPGSRIALHGSGGVQPSGGVDIDPVRFGWRATTP